VPRSSLAAFAPLSPAFCALLPRAHEHAPPDQDRDEHARTTLAVGLCQRATEQPGNASSGRSGMGSHSGRSRSRRAARGWPHVEGTRRHTQSTAARARQRLPSGADHAATLEATLLGASGAGLVLRPRLETEPLHGELERARPPCRS
jgi:hypothetical protein